MIKKVSIALVVLTLLAAVYLAGHFRLIPVQRILALKHMIEFRSGVFEHQSGQEPGDVEIKNTFLSRLLIKKVKLPVYGGYGGGLSVQDNLLFLISSKGDVYIYNLETFQPLQSQVDTAPLNMGELIQSGHPYKNDFQMNWFRVNGFLSERNNDDSFTIYVSHNRYHPESDCITHNISKTVLVSQNGGFAQQHSWETLFTSKPCINPEPDTYVSRAPYSGHISGGAIQHYGENHLLITVGDYNHHGLGGVPAYAMDSNNPYGKFILLNKTTGNWSVYAKGSRNPSGLFIDSSQNIWSVENGPDGGDELNLIIEDQNYGWPEVSHGIWYDPEYRFSELTVPGRHDTYRNPVFSWIPSIAPSSVIRIEGEKFPLWKGDLLVGTMRGQGLQRVRINSENQVIYDEEIHLGHRIRDLISLPDGKLALLTDDSYLILIDDGGASFEKAQDSIRLNITELNRFDNLVKDAPQVAEVTTGRAIFENRCASCHSLGKKSEIGPHLNNLFNREIGGLEDFDFSDELRFDNRKWNQDLLKLYLLTPESEFPGTSMEKVHLSETEVDSLIRYLNQTDELSTHEE